jgi:hypothetical protein
VMGALAARLGGLSPMQAAVLTGISSGAPGQAAAGAARQVSRQRLLPARQASTHAPRRACLGACCSAARLARLPSLAFCRVRLHDRAAQPAACRCGWLPEHGLHLGGRGEGPRRWQACAHRGGGGGATA